MPDSRRFLQPKLQRLIAAAEAKGTVIHVYAERKPRARLTIAIDGAPRVMVGDALDKLERCAGIKYQNA